MSGLMRWLAHPATRDLAVDDPRTTLLRRQIILDKPFLRRIYQEWYGLLLQHLPGVAGRVLELGAGGGFFRQHCPEALASEVFHLPQLDLVCDAQNLPLADASLRAVVMTDVLHHIPQVRRFFAEAARCVAPGGRIIMIEPWHSAWSRFIFTRFHAEPFVPEAGWDIPQSGPLSGANQALPWIVFERDRRLFEQEFPMWRLVRVRPFMPFRYLASGGVSLRALSPGWSFLPWRALETLLQPLMSHLAMFALIVLERQDGN